MNEEGYMTVGGGVQMLRMQYLAGYKEDCIAKYPTIARPSVNAGPAIDGTIDDVYKQYPELESILYNDVKMCSCGKPCAYTMTVCNSCGKALPDIISKSENVFTAFLFGVKLAARGFPYTISLRGESEDVLIFDDMLQLSACHLNGIPKKFYIPDWRYLLLRPKEALALLDTMEAELWAATLPFIQDPAFRKAHYIEGLTDEEIRKSIMTSFNFPPSQFQLHIQWIVPPMQPFQHFMTETKNHFHQGRGFPVSYVKNVLALDKTYPVTKDTTVESIIDWAKDLGVDYQTEWSEWYHDVCLAAPSAGMHIWNCDDFQYVVQDGKVYNFSVADGKVELGEQVPDASPASIQAKDKNILQNYGRPYNEAGKPGGTYIQNPLQPKFAEGGLQKWES
jgi:hypothetical protein